MPRKTARITKLRLALAISCLLAAGGGYGAYTKYFKSGQPAEASADDSEGVADSGISDNTEPPVEGTIDDPFGETLMSSSGGRSPMSAEPRKVADVADAAPIAGRNTRNLASRKNAVSRGSDAEDEPLDLDDPTDNANSLRRDHTDPEFSEESAGPAVGGSSKTPRRFENGNNSARRGPGSGTTRRDSAGGPRISPATDRDTDLSPEFPDDKLDGFDVAAQRSGNRHQKSSVGPRISVVDGRDEFEQDERIEGFVPDQGTTRRSVSKTKVVRSTDGLDDSSLAPAGGNSGMRRTLTGHPLSDDDEFTAPPAPLLSESERGSGSHSRSAGTAIQRRGTPPAPLTESSLRASRRTSDDEWESPVSASTTYRVAADDNFWKISRKQYGTARYFQALTRHNQDRIADPQKLRPGMQISTPSADYLEKNYPDLIEKGAPGAVAARGGDSRPTFEKPSSESFNGSASKAGAAEAAGGYFYSKAGDPLYRIGPDDTLTSIAQRHLGRASRWAEIYEQNRDILKSPDDLTLGTVIRLPGDASRLSLVPDNERRR